MNASSGRSKERVRFQPPGKIRSFGDQLEDLCEEKDLYKQDVAEKAGISPSQLAHYLKYGTSLRMIERISEAAGVPPHYFDVYVAENSTRIIMNNPELLAYMRAFHAASSEAKRRDLLKKLH